MKAHGTALALGGGGARGVAHVGVIEALVNGGIAIDHLFGVSIGSVVAAAFAFAPGQTATALQPAVEYLKSPVFQRYAREFHGQTAAREAENSGAHPEGADAERPHWLDRAVSYLRASRGFHRVLTTPSLLPGRILEQIISTLLPDADVADARIPLTIVAVDLVTGREVQITKGPLRAAVLGSASLPGIFPPVPYGGCLLADIGVISPVPCRAAFQAGAGHIIAVDVTHQPVRTRSFHTAFDVLLRLEDVASTLFLNAVLDIADTTIKPDVARLPWSDFSSVDATIEAGRVAAVAAIPGIRSAVALAAGGLPKAAPVAGIAFTDEPEPRRTA